MSVLGSALERPLAFHRSLVGPCGSIYAAILMSQAIYWSNRTDADKMGWFYKTAKEWEVETALTADQQVTARKLLVARGMLEEERRGLPYQLYYRVNMDAVEAGYRESANPDRQDPGQWIGKIPETLETTTETTTETTKSSRSPKQDLVDFETWYRAYPRKVGRGDAAKAWRQTKKDRPSIAELLAALEIQAASSKWSDKTYIPHPTSYLRALRWQDDLTLYQPAKTEPAPNPRLAAPVPIRDPIRKTRRLSGLVMAGPVGPLHENLTEDEWNARSAELGLGPWPEGEPE